MDFGIVSDYILAFFVSRYRPNQRRAEQVRLEFDIASGQTLGLITVLQGVGVQNMVPQLMGNRELAMFRRLCSVDNNMWLPIDHLSESADFLREINIRDFTACYSGRARNVIERADVTVRPQLNGFH